MASHTSNRLLRSSILLAAMAFAACGSSGYMLTVQAIPSDANVYINGEKIGSGSARRYNFDFADGEIYYVQAVHPDYVPFLETWDRRRIEEQYAANLPVRLPLRQKT